MFVMILSYNRCPDWLRFLIDEKEKIEHGWAWDYWRHQTMGPGCGDHLCYNDKKIKLRK